MKKSARNAANVFAGRNLKYFIESNGISQEQLAESFGIEKDSLQKILNGTNAISGPYNYILLNEYNATLSIFNTLIDGQNEIEFKMVLGKDSGRS